MSLILKVCLSCYYFNDLRAFLCFPFAQNRVVPELFKSLFFFSNSSTYIRNLCEIIASRGSYEISHREMFTLISELILVRQEVFTARKMLSREVFHSVK